MFTKLFGPKRFKFKCAECGKWHKGSPSFSYKRPISFDGLSDEEFAERVLLSDDLCRIEPAPGDTDQETEFYIRATLEIPIIGADEPFTWGVWVSQSEDSFQRYASTFEEDQTGDGSFGWLNVSMPHYCRSSAEEFDHLECDVHWMGKGERPKLVLWDNDHELVQDQKNGISWDKAISIAELTMHPE